MDVEKIDMEVKYFEQKNITHFSFCAYYSNFVCQCNFS